MGISGLVEGQKFSQALAPTSRMVGIYYNFVLRVMACELMSTQPSC